MPRYESPAAKKWLNMLKNGPTEGREEWLEKGMMELIEVVEYKHRQEYDLLMRADELSSLLEKKEKLLRNIAVTLGEIYALDNGKNEIDKLLRETVKNFDSMR